MGVTGWWKEVGLVPTPPVGQSRPYVQGGAGGVLLTAEAPPSGGSRHSVPRGGRRKYPVLVLAHTQHGGPAGLKGLPTGRVTS